MKKSILPLILLTLLLAPLISAQTVVEKLEKDIPALMKQADVPGMSAALIQNGKLVWKGSFGVQNAETREPVTDQTIFEAASLTKPVVAYAVLKLVDAGKIDLDTPLNKYLGNNYDAGEDKRIELITARHVLSHSSGFPNWRRPQDSKILPINFTPGEKFSYSGEGFVYLSKVVEKITGMDFEEFIQKTVFRPLGMKSSSLIWQESYNKLKIYKHDAFGKPTGQNKPEGFNAAATLHTTAEEYAKFAIAVLDGKGLKKETRNAMLTPQIKVNEEKAPQLAWGLGVGLETTPAGKFFWHWGDNGNSRAFVIASDKSKSGIVFFANSSNGLSFVREILDHALGGEYQSVAWLSYERFDSPARVLLKAVVERGAESALKTYLETREKNKETAIDEAGMNRLGYNLLQLKKTNDAIEIFRQNAADFPASANVWDSLAEAYMNNGEKDLAIEFYEKSLKLDPENKNAVEMLKKLKH